MSNSETTGDNITIETSKGARYSSQFKSLCRSQNHVENTITALRAYKPWTLALHSK
jgi:hypothetical protein